MRWSRFYAASRPLLKFILITPVFLPHNTYMCAHKNTVYLLDHEPTHSNFQFNSAAHLIISITVQFLASSRLFISLSIRHFQALSIAKSPYFFRLLSLANLVFLLSVNSSLFL